MKKILLVFLSLTIINGLTAQDKTENLDFSLVKNAPTYFSQINLTKRWKDVSKGTSDLYHKEGSKIVGIPNNGPGNQEAFSGNSYAGLVAYSETGSENYTEYIQARFSSPLTKGKIYDISFRVSLADNSGRAVNGLGAYISTEAVESQSNFIINASPQVVSNEVIKDKMGWVEVSGSYTSIGGEEYITIGLFNKVDKYITLSDVPENINKKRAYYYIDGITFSVLNEPDSDKDGIIDKEDNCPKVAGILALKGCPDSDGDGIIDSEDDCPNVKGLATLKGCPEKDTDNDGVPDSKDKCPTLKGTIANNGCLLSEEEMVAIKEASAHIYFETSSSKIKKESYPDLDRLTAILKKHPEVKAKVEGHTDSSGNADKNLALSKDRAASVKKYLIEHGEKEDHVSSEGYGSSKPITSNDTKEGRAKNRRVEIVVTSFEVSK